VGEELSRLFVLSVQFHRLTGTGDVRWRSYGQEAVTRPLRSAATLSRGAAAPSMAGRRSEHSSRALRHGGQLSLAGHPAIDNFLCTSPVVQQKQHLSAVSDLRSAGWEERIGTPPLASSGSPRRCRVSSTQPGRRRAPRGQGAIRYVSTPRGTPDPVKSPPIAAAPFYLPSTRPAPPSGRCSARTCHRRIVPIMDRPSQLPRRRSWEASTAEG
jgi:hypothetical protein